jgi:DNA-directed RNA polymerase subunit omega
MAEKLQGIVSPSIDNLLNKEFDTQKLSKYELVIFAAKRARQINEYYSALHEGSLFNNVGPLVETTIDEKPLTIALHEIDEDKLNLTRAAE